MVTVMVVPVIVTDSSDSAKAEPSSLISEKETICLRESNARTVPALVVLLQLVNSITKAVKHIMAESAVRPNFFIPEFNIFLFQA